MANDRSITIRAAAEPDAGRIADLMTRVRGSGAGRALVAAAEDLASRWGCVAVEVTSARHRADAHAFYAAVGFADACGRSARFFKLLPHM